MKRLLRHGAVLSALWCGSTWATPSVEGYDLVSSARSGRTTFDYSYALRVRVDGKSYSSASFNVTSSNPATQIVQGAVSIGPVDAGTFVRPAQTFTIRQDRTVAFDASALKFSFVGTSIGVSSGPNAVQVTTVDFLEQGGRPGHEGVFPIQGDNPDASASLYLHAAVFGFADSTSYRLLDPTTSAVIARGQMVQPPAATSWPDFYALITVPSTPFRVSITGVDDNGIGHTWQSAKIYTPRPYSLTLQPDKAIVKPGQSISLKLQVASLTASGPYTFSLLLPTGFTAQSGPWTVNLVPGQAVTLTTALSIATTVNDFAPVTVSASGVASGAMTGQYSNMQFFVE